MNERLSAAGRGERIRTSDSAVPERQYSTRLSPDSFPHAGMSKLHNHRSSRHCSSESANSIRSPDIAWEAARPRRWHSPATWRAATRLVEAPVSGWRDRRKIFQPAPCSIARQTMATCPAT